MKKILKGMDALDMFSFIGATAMCIYTIGLIITMVVRS